MDEVGSRLNLANAEKDSDTLQEQMDEIVSQKETAAEKEDYETADNLRYQEIELQKQIDKAKEAKKEDESFAVTVHDIEEIVEEKTGIPVTKLQKDEQEKLQNIKEHLSEKVIGQEQAVDNIAKAV